MPQSNKISEEMNRKVIKIYKSGKVYKAILKFWYAKMAKQFTVKVIIYKYKNPDKHLVEHLNSLTSAFTIPLLKRDS